MSITYVCNNTYISYSHTEFTAIATYKPTSAAALKCPTLILLLLHIVLEKPRGKVIHELWRSHDVALSYIVRDLEIIQGAFQIAKCSGHCLYQKTFGDRYMSTTQCITLTRLQIFSQRQHVFAARHFAFAI